MSGACGTTEVVPCYKAFRLVVVRVVSYPMSQRRGPKFCGGAGGAKCRSFDSSFGLAQDDGAFSFGLAQDYGVFDFGRAQDDKQRFWVAGAYGVKKANNRMPMFREAMSKERSNCRSFAPLRMTSNNITRMTFFGAPGLMA
jgi:hypothetical protein